MVLDHRFGVVNHFQTTLLQSQTEVDVLEIGRMVALVEPPGLDPDRARHEKGARRTIRDASRSFASRAWCMTADAESRSVGPDDAARFLQTTVRKQNLAADGSDPRPGPHRGDERGEPAFPYARVIVEKHQVSAVRVSGASVARGRETHIRPHAQHGCR